MKFLKVLTLAISAVTSFTALASDPQKIIRFGVDPTYPPFESKNQSGDLEGFDIELGNAICEKLEAKCVWIVNDFDGLIPGLKARKYDGIFSSMQVTDARKRQVDFSDRLFNARTVLVVRKGSGLKPTAESLAGKSVGAEQGTAQEIWAKANLAPKNVNVRGYQAQDQAYGDLISGRLDGTFQDELQAKKGFLNTPQGQDFVATEPVDDPMLPKMVAIGVIKGNSGFKADLDKAIAAIHEDGTFKALQNKYFGDFDLYAD